MRPLTKLAAYLRVAQRLLENEFVRMELEDGTLTPKIAALKALPESESFKALVRLIETLYPEVDLPELLLEINARNGFVTAMIEANEVEPIAADVETSIIAVLVAQACIHKYLTYHLTGLDGAGEGRGEGVSTANAPV